jgi:predicted HicB family RNase H-like nuclease
MYTILVKRITFRADEKMIEQAHKAAADQNITLNTAFREWLITYTTQKSTASSSAL